MLRTLLEKLKRPGLLGIIGIRADKQCREQLHTYFQALGHRIAAMQLERLADPDGFVQHVQLVQLARHTVQMKLAYSVRTFTPLLQGILEINIHDALMASNKIHHFAEAVEHEGKLGGKRGENEGKTGRKLAEADDETDGPNAPDTPSPYVPTMTSEEAALYASIRAGEQVSGINATTQKIIADVIEEGITERLGVDGTKRLLMATLKDMAANRARMIASTELNDAFSEATMRKLTRLGVEFKQWICSADACDACLENEADGAIPLDGTFSGTDDERPPAHPSCRCAISGARAPAEA